MKCKLSSLLFVGFLFCNFCLAQQRPNIIVILADDLGYGDVQSYNKSGKIPTPNIDGLAAEGMRFTDAHSSSAICTPSRYSLLTGRYHWRSRLQQGIVEKWERPLITPERLTIAGFARQAGYQTAAIGKWHLGWVWPIDEQDKAHFTRFGAFERKSKDSVTQAIATDDDRAAWTRTFSRPIKGGPLAVGFDSYFGTDVPNWPPFCFIQDERTVGIPTEFLPNDLITTNQASFQGPALKGWRLEDILQGLEKHAVGFINKQQKSEKPFLLYLSLTSPHTPLAVSGEWKDKSGLNNTYADFVMQTDAVVGSVVEALKQNGLDQNTLIVFTSDNGCGSYIGVEDLQARGHLVSGGLRGYKGDIWEGGSRIPFIIKYPGIAKPGSICDKLVLQADLIATFADIFGKKIPDNAGEDSYSLLPLLQGEKKAVREQAVTCRWDGLHGFRMGDWKLICTTEPQLFNLRDDPAEKTNVAAANPAVVQKMQKLRRKIIDEGRSTPGKPQQNDVKVKEEFAE